MCVLSYVRFKICIFVGKFFVLLLVFTQNFQVNSHMLQPFVCVLVNIDWNTLQELSSLHLMDIGHLTPTMLVFSFKTCYQFVSYICL